MTFRRLDSVSVFRWNLLSWAKSIELFPITGLQHQHKHSTNRRQGIALSIGHNWVGSTWRRRHNPVSETLCVLNKSRTMDRVQKHNNCINIPSSQTLGRHTRTLFYIRAGFWKRRQDRAPVLGKAPEQPKSEIQLAGHCLHCEWRVVPSK
jgi:hypothetical protein